MDWKLELVTVPVSDVDRAKAFYVEQAGFVADHDHVVNEGLRFVQLTPPGSACSIAIGEGLVDGEPGSVKGLQVVVDDVQAWRAELMGRGIDVGDVQDLAWGSAARVTCPVLVVVAAQDHVVDEAGAAGLVRRLEKSPSVRYVRIEDSAHILPRDRNRELVASEVTGFVERTLGPAAVR